MSSEIAHRENVRGHFPLGLPWSSISDEDSYCFRMMISRRKEEKLEERVRVGMGRKRRSGRRSTLRKTHHVILGRHRKLYGNLDLFPDRIW